MLDTLYSLPACLARVRAAPLVEERERYLQFCADHGHKLQALRKISWLLFLTVTHVSLDRRIIDSQTIRHAAERHRVRLQRTTRSRRSASSQRIFVGTATRFFRSIGRLAPSALPPVPLEPRVTAYQDFLRKELGWSPDTIAANCRYVRQLLLSVRPRPTSLRAITIKHIDRYLITQSQKTKSWSRRSIATLAWYLRRFFRFAETQNWCNPGIAAAIVTSRRYAREGLPRSPAWEQVERLVAHTTGDKPAQIRDLAIVLLLTVYALRRGEVAALKLDDIDWEAGSLRVYRSKQRRFQSFPLVRPVADAIIRYLREVRPRCVHRELFLAMKPPIRALSASSISILAKRRLQNVRVTLPRVGAHCLRHACAQHLLARGFSLKEIGDQLGHRSTSATSIYAKVDLAGLRQVAELDLGRLL